MYYNEITKNLLSETPDNIVGVGIGRKVKNGFLTFETGITFSVKEKLPLEQIPENERIPEYLEYSGITFKTDVIQGETKPLISFCYDEFYTWMDVYTTPIKPTNRNKIRPLKGATSTTNYTNMMLSTGTLGFLAKDNEDNTLVGVSNAHVWIENPALPSQRSDNPITNTKDNLVVQSSTIDFNEGGTYNDYIIGKIKRYKPWNESSTINFIDCALTTIDSSVIDASESWKIEGFTGITTGMQFATTQEINDLLTNDADLYLGGRSSASKGEGRTKMKMSSLFFSTTTSYSYSSVKYNDLFRVVATDGSGGLCYEPDWGGDSGSVVFADINGTKKIIGLVFAGTLGSPSQVLNPWTSTYVDAYDTAICCRIDRIASIMNISPWTGQTISYSDTTNIDEYVINGLWDAEYITYNGKKYFLAGLTASVTGNTWTTTTTTQTPTTTTTNSPTTTTTTTNLLTISCSSTGIFERTHSSITVDGVMYLGERKENPYIVRFADPDNLDNYTRISVTNCGNDNPIGLESVVQVGTKLYFSTLETTTGYLVIVEVDTTAETLAYTKHIFNTLSVWNFAITTDGTYIYGGSDNQFFKIRISDWEIVAACNFFSDFYQTHAGAYDSVRNKVYLTSQGTEMKLAVIDASNIYSYQIFNLSAYTNTLTDDMVYYDGKLYIGSENAGGVIVDVANNYTMTSLDILPSYGLVRTGSTIWNAAKDGYIQKFNVNTPYIIGTYKIDEVGFIPNEILFVGSRAFVTKWGGPTEAKLCEIT